jgi:hypothetical protein
VTTNITSTMIRTAAIAGGGFDQSTTGPWRVASHRAEMERSTGPR